MRNFRIGCLYSVKHGNFAAKVKLVRFDPIDRLHVVRFNGREIQMDLHKIREVRRSFGKADKIVFLYLCELGGGAFKVGVSSCPSTRQKQIKTYSQKARMRAIVRIPDENTARFRRYEQKVLDKFAGQRSGGGKEVLLLSASEANACARYMRSIARLVL